MDFRQRRRVDPLLGTQPVAQRTTGYLPLKSRRNARGAELLQAVHRLDMEIDAAARADLTRWVRERFDTEFGDVPLGFVARCYLGPPYVDHRLDLFHSILDHYAPGDVMPEPYARARILARSSDYAYVEVYASGELLPVRPDGFVVA